MVPPHVRRRTLAATAAAVALTAGCSEEADPAGTSSATRTPSPSSAPPTDTPSDAPSDPASETPSAEATSEGTSEPASAPRLQLDDLNIAIALVAIDRLAGRIGPRHATSPAYAEAARWVSGELEGLGYRVRSQRVQVPGGDSWGVLVEAGTSTNVVARLPGTDLTEPHLVVGAHLDTVPQAPGAEDNASGVGVMLAAATAAASAGTRLPVVFVAFGAEEPRGPTDADHHYGSRAYVAALSPAERRAVRGMVSLDRVGVGASVPVGTALEGVDPAHQEVLAAAERADVSVQPDLNRSSDHWQFVQVGMPGVRLGSTPYAAYHSARDLPGVIQPAQLTRTGRILLAWLARE